MKYLAEVSRALKNGIYIIYMGFCRAKYNNIAASTSDFFFVLGHPRFRGYIVVYSRPKPYI